MEAGGRYPRASLSKISHDDFQTGKYDDDARGFLADLQGKFEGLAASWALHPENISGDFSGLTEDQEELKWLVEETVSRSPEGGKDSLSLAVKSCLHRVLETVFAVERTLETNVEFLTLRLDWAKAVVDMLLLIDSSVHRGALRTVLGRLSMFSQKMTEWSLLGSKETILEDAILDNCVPLCHVFLEGKYYIRGTIRGFIESFATDWAVRLATGGDVNKACMVLRNTGLEPWETLTDIWKRSDDSVVREELRDLFQREAPAGVYKEEDEQHFQMLQYLLKTVTNPETVRNVTLQTLEGLSEEEKHTLLLTHIPCTGEGMVKFVPGEAIWQYLVRSGDKETLVRWITTASENAVFPFCTRISEDMVELATSSQEARCALARRGLFPSGARNDLQTLLTLVCEISAFSLTPTPFHCEGTWYPWDLFVENLTSFIVTEQLQPVFPLVMAALHKYGKFPESKDILPKTAKTFLASAVRLWQDEGNPEALASFIRHGFLHKREEKWISLHLLALGLLCPAQPQSLDGQTWRSVNKFKGFAQDGSSSQPVTLSEFLPPLPPLKDISCSLAELAGHRWSAPKPGRPEFFLDKDRPSFAFLASLVTPRGDGGLNLHSSQYESQVTLRAFQEMCRPSGPSGHVVPVPPVPHEVGDWGNVSWEEIAIDCVRSRNRLPQVCRWAASRNHWPLLVSLSAVFSFPQDQVIECLKELPSRVLGENLEFALGIPLKSETPSANTSRGRLYSRIGVSPEKLPGSGFGSPGSSDAGSLFEELASDASLAKPRIPGSPSDLFATILDAQHDPRPGPRLLRLTFDLKNPLLAVLATCFQDVDWVDCACCWLAASLGLEKPVEPWGWATLTDQCRLCVRRGHLSTLYEAFRIFLHDYPLTTTIQYLQDFSLTRTVSPGSPIPAEGGNLSKEEEDCCYQILLEFLSHECFSWEECSTLLALFRDVLPDQSADLKELEKLSSCLHSWDTSPRDHPDLFGSMEARKERSQEIWHRFLQAGDLERARRLGCIFGFPGDQIATVQILRKRAVLPEGTCLKACLQFWIDEVRILPATLIQQDLSHLSPWEIYTIGMLLWRRSGSPDPILIDAHIQALLIDPQSQELVEKVLEGSGLFGRGEIPLSQDLPWDLRGSQSQPRTEGHDQAALLALNHALEQGHLPRACLYAWSYGLQSEELEGLVEAVKEAEAERPIPQLLSKGRILEAINVGARAAQALHIPYSELVEESRGSPNVILARLLEQEEFGLAGGFVRALTLPPSVVNHALHLQIVLFASLSQGLDEDGEEKLESLLRLSSDPLGLGESLLGEAHDTLAGDAKTSVGLTIAASRCFMRVCSIEGLSAVLRLSRSIAAKLAAAQLWSLMVQLLIGVGRFTEMSYIYQILRENQQSEVLLRRGLEKHGGLRTSLLAYVKRECPGDHDLYQLVALTFLLYREVSQSWEGEGIGKISQLMSRKSLLNDAHSKSLLNAALSSFTHAAEYYVQAEYLSKAMECSSQACLVALQLNLLNRVAVDGVAPCVLRLQPDKFLAVLTAPRLLSFREAELASQAYPCHAVDWSLVLFHQVVVHGDQNYLKDFVKSQPLHASLMHGITNRALAEGEISEERRRNVQFLLDHCDDMEAVLRAHRDLNLPRTFGNSDPDLAYFRDLGLL